MTSLSTYLRALRDDDAAMRQDAALRLGREDATPILADLVPMLAAEPDDFVRETLTWAVVAQGEAAVPHLLEALERDDLPHEPLLHALSKLQDPQTVAAIVPHADDEDPTVASKAWWALARIATPEVLPVLLAHLGSADAERRHGLTRALLQVGGDAIDPLAAELESDDPARRSHAAEVLTAFADADRYGALERRAGRDHSERAASILREADAPEVNGALLLASIDDRPGLAAAAERLQEERAER